MDLLKMLTTHYNPTPSETIQRFKFHSRVRKTGKTVATYVSELRLIAEYYNFGSSLEEMLCLVCGINNDTIQNRLLSEAKLTLKKAIDLVQGLESAAKNAKELKPLASVTPLETVHKVTTTDKDGSVTCH